VNYNQEEDLLLDAAKAMFRSGLGLNEIQIRIYEELKNLLGFHSALVLSLNITEKIRDEVREEIRTKRRRGAQ